MTIPIEIVNGPHKGLVVDREAFGSAIVVSTTTFVSGIPDGADRATASIHEKRTNNPESRYVIRPLKFGNGEEYDGYVCADYDGYVCADNAD